MAKYDHAAVIEMVRKCLNESVEARKVQVEIPSPFPGEVGSYLTDPWPVYEEFRSGDHWARMGKQAAWKTTPVDNFIFTVIESNTTKLTDNRPKVVFAPRTPDAADACELLNHRFDEWWEKANGAVIDALAVKDSRTFGVGWLHLRYDKARKKQVLEVIHPESIWVDPDTTADSFFADEPNYLIYEYVASVADIIAAYDVKMDELRPNWLADQTAFERVRSFFTAHKSVENPATTLPVYEMWIRDPTTDTWEEEFGDQIVKKRGLRYPGGRVIKVCGGVVLSDEANPYKHKEFGFAPVHCYPQSGKFYSIGDVQQLLPLQVVSDKYDQLIIDQTLKSGGGIILTNRRHGLFGDQITNDVVQVHEVTDVNQAFKMESMPAPSRHIVDHKATIRQAMQDMAGLHDASMGRYTPGNKTAGEVSMINESDNTRIRLAAKFHSMALTRIGRQWLSNELQYGQKDVVRRTDAEGNELVDEYDPTQMRDLSFDVIVGDFAMLPDTYQERKQQAFVLFDKQVIDAEELLKTLEWPNYKAVTTRMTQKLQADQAAQAQAMAAQQAQMQPPMGQPPMGPQMGAPPPEMGAEPTEEDLAMIEQIAADNGITPEEVIAQMMTGAGVA